MPAGAPQGISLRRRVAVVIDAQSATEIDVLDRDAGGFDGIHKVQHAIHGVEVGRSSSVICEPIWQSMPTTRRPGRRLRAGRCQGAFVRDAKFVAFEAGGNVRMGLGVHVGVDADAHRRPLAERQRHFAQHLKFGLALDVEAADACLQGVAHFGAGLAHA
jgi:hypothetical protein